MYLKRHEYVYEGSRLFILLSSKISLSGHEYKLKSHEYVFNKCSLTSLECMGKSVGGPTNVCKGSQRHV